MTSHKKPTKATALAGVQALIAGIQKHIPNGQFTLGNVVYTSAALIQLLTDLAGAMTAQTAAQKTATDALTALQAMKVKADPVVQDLRDLLRTQFGQASLTLADFALTPRKARAPMTVQQKAAAAAKREATLAARGTTSAKAKQANQGTAPVPTEAIPAAPAATPAKPVS